MSYWGNIKNSRKSSGQSYADIVKNTEKGKERLRNQALEDTWTHAGYSTGGELTPEEIQRRAQYSLESRSGQPGSMEWYLDNAQFQGIPDEAGINQARQRQALALNMLQNRAESPDATLLRARARQQALMQQAARAAAQGGSIGARNAVVGVGQGMGQIGGQAAGEAQAEGIGAMQQYAKAVAAAREAEQQRQQQQFLANLAQSQTERQAVGTGLGQLYAWPNFLLGMVEPADNRTWLERYGNIVAAGANAAGALGAVYASKKEKDDSKLPIATGGTYQWNDPLSPVSSFVPKG